MTVLYLKKKTNIAVVSRFVLILFFACYALSGVAKGRRAVGTYKGAAF